MVDLSVTDVAKEIGIRRESVVQFIESGLLVAYVASLPDAKRKVYRITRAAIDNFKADRSAKPAPKTTTTTRRKAKREVPDFFGADGVRNLMAGVSR